jgi:hypothetical protein
MKSSVRLFALLGVLLLSAPAWAQTGWIFEGCWSPYPNYIGAKDVYFDADGNEWECGLCGTTVSPSPSTCYQADSLHDIGYWCTPGACEEEGSR